MKKIKIDDRAIYDIDKRAKEYEEEMIKKAKEKRELQKKAKKPRK